MHVASPEGQAQPAMHLCTQPRSALQAALQLAKLLPGQSRWLRAPKLDTLFQQEPVAVTALTAVNSGRGAGCPASTARRVRSCITPRVKVESGVPVKTAASASISMSTSSLVVEDSWW